MIAFSTDSSVAGRGVYLLSFLPGIRRQPHRRLRRRHRQAVLRRAGARQCLWQCGRGGVQAGGRPQGRPHRRVREIRRRPRRRRRAPWRRRSARPMRCCIADDGDSVVATADALTAAGANLRNIQLLGTGLWDNPRVFASPALQGGLYAAPDPSGFRGFSGRYRTRFGGDPVRTATLAYDAVALVAALARTQGRAALRAGDADQSVRLCRHRRPVPLPLRRHQRARPRRDAGRVPAAARRSPARRRVLGA